MPVFAFSTSDVHSTIPFWKTCLWEPETTSLLAPDLVPETVVGKVYLLKGKQAEDTYSADRSKSQKVPLHDLRDMEDKPNLETDGFTYVSGWHINGIEDMVEFSEEHRAALEADSVELVKELTGAKSAYTYSMYFRDHTSPNAPKSAPVIHSDMSPEGAEYMKGVARKVFLTSPDPMEIRFGKYMREGKNIAIFNVWRPICTVEDNHLGLCNWRSLVKEDAVNFNIKPHNGLSSAQAWKYREGQQWFYLSKQQPNEAFVFMQHDSRAPDGHGINVPHASFKLKKDAGKPPTRMSFEARVVAILGTPTDPPIEPPIGGRLSEFHTYMLSGINHVINRIIPTSYIDV
ncbi:uncharacterized protein MELLADRAFT_108363 [Melampsora larici-populina 98AG31]|uniref:Uncharacterized protein n=1 Tax=Melampsora larici-populina (strain 98AG31 / pathotype 3-4-7) TaxID=747676 RepID=F4RSV5_MELLP|nr:uncharacterized protein MELLADRAFT_108363 [Melampsora larici-populina 98AG31]EGG04540.1 hypothetical protein MELLADRAFT_108363 [Melampsora larici-populina 98AG31]